VRESRFRVELLPHYGNRVLGMKRYCVSFVSIRTKGEFSTRPWVMPPADLMLNVAIPSPERPIMAASAYVMPDTLAERCQIEPGCASTSAAPISMR